MKVIFAALCWSSSSLWARNPYKFVRFENSCHPVKENVQGGMGDSKHLQSNYNFVSCTTRVE